jgi:uncharacterized ion transporter superfamily protein YfcC
MKFVLKVKKFFKRITYYILFFFLMIFILLGTWCIPPKWFEKVANALKAKFNIELVLEDGNREDNNES